MSIIALESLPSGTHPRYGSPPLQTLGASRSGSAALEAGVRPNLECAAAFVSPSELQSVGLRGGNLAGRQCPLAVPLRALHSSVSLPHPNPQTFLSADLPRCFSVPLHILRHPQNVGCAREQTITSVACHHIATRAYSSTGGHRLVRQHLADQHWRA